LVSLLRATLALWRNCENSLGSVNSREYAEQFTHPLWRNWFQGRPTVEISQLVDQHYESVFRFAYRLSGTSHEAEDISQQAFLDAQRKLYTLRDPDKVRAWLFMIVRNLYRRQIRDRVTHGEVALEVLADPVDKRRGSGERVEQALDSESLQQVLNELPEEFRSVLLLFYFRELSYREIAEQLDVPIGTVMSRLSRGKKQLRERISPESY
jgi:RNA polymerase sigma-70 factor (ECF subfamily)